ncbi:MAG: cation:proton antiporter [Pseudomonadota bacterium]
MDATAYLALVLLLLGIVLASGFALRVFVTGPVLAMGAGLLLHHFGAIPQIANDHLLEIVAEAALAVVLFADAAQLKLAALKDRAGWASRMLLIGMPAACLLGLALFALLLPGWPLWQVVLLAALLVPTDAALSQHMFANEAVPARIRDTLTIESGLNDGVALPFILFAGCAAVGFAHDVGQANWLAFALQQIGAGFAAGLLIGTVGGFVVARLARAASVSAPAAKVAALLLIPLAYFSAEALGGNSFVAVFLAGIGFGVLSRRAKAARPVSHAPRTDLHGTELEARDPADATLGFIETNSLLTIHLAFVYIGAALLPDAVEALTPTLIGGVLASLFLVRPLAIWIALAGTKADLRTKLVLGWFGPRGLATALFAVFALTQFFMIEHREEILAITTLTVAVSAVLHGLTAFAAPLLCGRETKPEREPLPA